MIVVKYRLKIVACSLITDFLSGLLPWMETAHGNEDWPITGKLITNSPDFVYANGILT